VYKPQKRGAIARGLPAPNQRSVRLLGKELDQLLELKEMAERAMLDESHRHRITRILETAPGLGPIRVAQMVPIVVTPYRFRTKRQFWSYSGFGVVTRSSGDWVRENGRWVKAQVVQTRGLSFSHNRMLKAIFKGAATTVISHSGPNVLREDYDRLLENGTKPNLAKLTIARKVAAIVLSMWKKEKKYDPRRHRSLTGAEVS
jgi:transposase